ncbi:MAG: hypothetical protein MJ089_00955 [Ruminococcus sp.]|nr:hypothetical protein [Ruminococcus sp.]
MNRIIMGMVFSHTHFDYDKNAKQNRLSSDSLFYDCVFYENECFSEEPYINQI